MDHCYGVAAFLVPVQARNAKANDPCKKKPGFSSGPGFRGWLAIGRESYLIVCFLDLL